MLISSLCPGHVRSASQLTGDEKSDKPWAKMNTIVANMLLNMSSGSRFEGSLNVDLNELTMNLVPFPSMHFLTSSLTPLYELADVRVPPRRLDQMFSDAFQPDFQLMRCQPRHGVFSACALMLRGKVSVSDARRNVDRIKPQLKFARWNEEGWKIGLCDTPSSNAERSLLCLGNNTSIRQSFLQVQSRFDKLYRKRAFKHHFTNEGMDEARFGLAIEGVVDICQRYQELEAEYDRHPSPEPRLQVV